MKEKILWIWLSKIDISNKIKLDLIKKFKGIENIWKANADDFIYFKFNNTTIDKIMDLNLRKNLEEEFEFMVKNNIDIINYTEKNYPKKLLQINNFPIVLYYIGNIKLLSQRNIAIVGSRFSSEYGKTVARNISKQLSDFKINIVSGLAIGIDKYAHLGALDSKIGKTIAILGTGISDFDIYPLQNKKIFDRILENKGLVLSEYIIGTKPLKHHFPLRNRIISGISEKILVVEATEKSGSLITANYGLEQGKDIYAVPGRIQDVNSKGTNKLIKERSVSF